MTGESPIAPRGATVKGRSSVNPAVITIDPRKTVAPVSRGTFGAFVEHMGRSVYGGIYEPDHPSADAEGFRQDVIDLVRELGVSTLRYPGGNFVSGYRWEDGVGPRDQRPVRRDLAWRSIEPNTVGLDEFARWCRLVGGEMILAVNLGTRGVLDAVELLEYTNHPSGTRLSDWRVANGHPEPHGVRMWCLGNEMDGPWQVGAMSAEDYGKLAGRTAAAMKMADPHIELVVCGSSSSSMSTFGVWERTVLDHTYEHVDYISCHAYYEERGGDLAAFLASSIDMERFIDAVVAAADHVKHTLRHEKTMHISFDEWNVWYHDRYVDEDRSREPWGFAPRLLEDVYSVADAVVVGSLLITLLRRSDRVRSASLAQLVNVIAPIMTEPGGHAWRQTTFFPFAITSARASGTVVDARVETDRYTVADLGDVPYVDAVVTYDAERATASVFAVNRDLGARRDLRIDLSQLGQVRVVDAITLSDDDPYAANTRENPDRVQPRVNMTARHQGTSLVVELPPVSWSAITLSFDPPDAAQSPEN
jgi:alpha-N-arabinofuranosidase